MNEKEKYIENLAYEKYMYKKGYIKKDTKWILPKYNQEQSLYKKELLPSKA